MLTVKPPAVQACGPKFRFPEITSEPEGLPAAPASEMEAALPQSKLVSDLAIRASSGFDKDLASMTKGKSCEE